LDEQERDVDGDEDAHEQKQLSHRLKVAREDKAGKGHGP
jgi:hypothetical protein